MKKLVLFLALLLGCAAVLRAQPTNREYNRLHQATTRAYSVPDRPAPASTRPERTYTPSSSGANTPYSGGVQAPVDGSFLLGEKYRQRVRVAEEEKRRQEAEREAADPAVQAAKEARDQAQAQAKAQADAEAKEKRAKLIAANRKMLTAEIGKAREMWQAANYAHIDEIELIDLTRELWGKTQPYAAENLPTYELAYQARTTLQLRLQQPDASFAELQQLIAAEWGTVKTVLGGKSFGRETARRDYAELQRRFPTQAAELADDLLRLKVAQMAVDSQYYFDYSKDVLKQLPAKEAVVAEMVSKVAGPLTSGMNINCRDMNQEQAGQIEPMARLVYDACKVRLAQTPHDAELTQGLASSALVLIKLDNFFRRVSATSLEWRLAATKGQDGAEGRVWLATYLLDETLGLREISKQDWLEVCAVYNINSSVDWVKLARMMRYNNATPDNPDWLTLREDRDLSSAIILLSANASNAMSDVLKANLMRCTARFGSWEEAVDLWQHAKSRPESSKFDLTAWRNLYRAYRLDEVGSKYDENYMDWLMAVGSTNAPEMHYDMALLLLDQHPDFLPIGKKGSKQKKRAVEHLTAAAAAGYAPAQAKLKEL